MGYERTPEVTEARRLAEESRLRAAAERAAAERAAAERAAAERAERAERAAREEREERDKVEEIEAAEAWDEENGDLQEAMMNEEEELAYLRHEHSVLMAHNATLRASYSAAAQEASALRRQLLSKAPTVRERAAIAIMPHVIGMNPYEAITASAARAIRYADALMLMLKGDIDEP